MKCLKRFSAGNNNNVCFQFNFSFSRRRGRKYVSIAISGAHTGFDRARIFQNPRKTRQSRLCRDYETGKRSARGLISDAGRADGANKPSRVEFPRRNRPRSVGKRKNSNSDRPSFPQTRFNVSKLFRIEKSEQRLGRQQVEVDLRGIELMQYLLRIRSLSSSQERAIHMIIKLSDSTSTWNTQLRSRLQLKASE